MDVPESEPPRKVEQSLEKNRKAILALPGVVGAGVGKCGDDLCIKVIVLEDSPDINRKLDVILGDTPYVVEESGPIRPLLA